MFQVTGMDFLQMASLAAGVALSALALYITRRQRLYPMTPGVVPPIWTRRRLGTSLVGVAESLDRKAPRRRARDVMRERKRMVKEGVPGGVVNEKCTYCLDSLEKGPDVRVTKCRHAL